MSPVARLVVLLSSPRAPARNTGPRWLAGLCTGIAVLLLPRPALPAPYEMFVDIESEEELDGLRARRDISEETYAALAALLHRGVDLNRAGRQELYALPNLTYSEVDGVLATRRRLGELKDGSVLVEDGILSEEKYLAIAPFLRRQAAPAESRRTRAYLHAQSGWSPGDARVPTMALRARLDARDLRAGVATVMTRNRLGEAIYDPNRDALVADGYKTRFWAPKFFAVWSGDDLVVFLGTYRAGFGQRLTFDTSGREAPNGLYSDDAVVRRRRPTSLCRAFAAARCGPDGGYVAADIGWREGLMGIGASLRRDTGRGAAEVHGFWSVAPYSASQYELYDSSRCDDPRADASAACAAPALYEWPADSRSQARRLRWQTLPSMYRQTTGGGHAAYDAHSRARVGVTGYASTVKFLASGIDWDFQEWSRVPFGGPFGALGVDAAWGRSAVDLFAEVARSFDSMPGGGGIGGVARAVVARAGPQQWEASVRYYQTSFANPFARPIAAPDRVEGLRPRGETGARLQYIARFGARLHIRGSGDVWMRPQGGKPRASLYLRSDLDATARLRAGLSLRQGADLACADSVADRAHDGEPSCWLGPGRVTARLSYGGPTVRVAASGRLWGPTGWRALAGARHQWGTSLDASARATRHLQVRAGLDSVTTAAAAGQSARFSHYAAMTWRAAGGSLALGLRYERWPNLQPPEASLPSPTWHGLWLEVTSSF